MIGLEVATSSRTKDHEYIYFAFYLLGQKPLQQLRGRVQENKLEERIIYSNIGVSGWREQEQVAGDALEGNGVSEG